MSPMHIVRVCASVEGFPPHDGIVFATRAGFVPAAWFCWQGVSMGTAVGGDGAADWERRCLRRRIRRMGRSQMTPAETATLKRLNALQTLPDGPWRMHAGDLAHGESPALDDSELAARCRRSRRRAKRRCGIGG